MENKKDLQRKLNLWKTLIDQKRFHMIRVQSGGKVPIEGNGWQNCGYRKFEEIGFAETDNAGVLTGPEAGLIVLDIDDTEAFDCACSVHKWQIPETFTVKTGKGFHYYFILPELTTGAPWVSYRNRSSKKEGYDIRAASGFVVAPGSLHPSGKSYEVAKDADLAMAPQWLLELSVGESKDAKPSAALRVATLDIPEAPTESELVKYVDDPEIVKLIIQGADKGHRSNAVFSVIRALLIRGCDDEMITAILLRYPIGEKAQEKANPEAFILDEIDRIRDKIQDELTGFQVSPCLFKTTEGATICPMDEPNDAAHRRMHIPGISEYPKKYRGLAENAHCRLVDTLKTYGNNVSITHSEALQMLIQIYTGMAAGRVKGRIAVPLPTGMGKTTSIIAFLGIAYEMGLFKTSNALGKQLTVAVAASKVEQLCELKEALISAGVPEAYIALVHSYKFDPNVERDADGLLPQGYAKLPADDDLKKATAPIMLLTHNKVKNGPTSVFDKTLQNKTFTIWDESLVTTESRALSIGKLKYGLPILEVTISELKRIDTPADRNAVRKLESTHRFLKEVFDVVLEEVQAQDNCNFKRILRFPPLNEGELTEMFESIAWAAKHCPQEGLKESLTHLRTLLRMTEYDTAVHRGKSQGNEAVVQFSVVVPDNIENIVILDASTKINKLMMLDETIWTPKDLPKLRLSYEQVSFHRINHKAGRSGVEKELTEDKVGLAACLCEIIGKHPNEGILLFTYNHREGELNHRQTIEEKMRDEGIDPGATLANGKPRFNWLTHGNETASNQFTHCTVAIFIGLLYKPQEATLGRTIGQRRNLSEQVAPEMLTDVELSEQAQALHQGANRTASRIIKNDLAQRSVIYYTYRTDALVPWVHEVMSGAQFTTYVSDAMKARTRSEAVLWAVLNYLSDLASKGERMISGRALTRAVEDLTTISKAVKTEILRRIVADPSVPWTREGRSYVYIG